MNGHQHGVIRRGMRVRALVAAATIASVSTVVGAVAPNAAIAAPASSTGIAFSDNFDDNGLDGWSLNASAPGTETTATGGQLRFLGIEFDENIARTYALTPGTFYGVALDFVSANVGGAQVTIEVGQNGSNWISLFSISDFSVQGEYSAAIPQSHTTATTSVRIRVSDEFSGNNDQMLFDDFEIYTTAAPSPTNPDLPPACGIDVTLVLDESGSIYDAVGGEQGVENGVTALVAALQDTDSFMRISEFSNNGRLASVGGNTAYQPVDAAYTTAINSYLGLNDSANAEIATSYSPGFGQRSTNWEAGLRAAVPGLEGPNLPNNNRTLRPNLVIFMTDGVPNQWYDPNPPGTAILGSGGSFEPNAIVFATDEVNAIKATTGSITHVLGIGVGDASNPTNFGRIRDFVEPVGATTWATGDPIANLNISTVDAINAGTDFGGLSQALRQVVYSLCAPQVSIQKLNAATNQPIGIPWSFSGAVNVTPATGGVDQYQWRTPSTGVVTADNSDDNSDDTGGPYDGGTADDVYKSLATNVANGTAVFEWTPNSVASPQPWNSTFSFQEVQTTTWRLAPTQDDCVIERLNVDGTIATLYAGLTWVTEADGNTVTFKLMQKVGGQGSANTANEFQITRADKADCKIKNVQLSTITIVKDAVPNHAQDFTFTSARTAGTGPNLLPATMPSLDDDSGAADANNTLSNTTGAIAVWPGTYTVTEGSLPANWALTNVTGNCTRNGTTSTVTITVLAGANATCTFVNTGTANLRLIKEWVASTAGNTAALSATGGFAGATINGHVATAPNLTPTSPTIQIPIGSAVAISEVVNPAANYVSGITCDNGNLGAVNANANGVASTVTADAGDVGQLITCTFNNARKGQIIIQKQTVNGNGTFTFSSPTVDFVPNQPDTITTVNGNGTTTLSASVAAGQYVVTEAANSGFTLTNLVCSDVGQPAGQASTVNIGAGAATINVAAGETVTCAYTNTRNSATFTLVKDWQDATPGNVVNLAADGTDVANGHIIASSSTAPTDTTSAMTVFSGETISFSEAFAVPANAANYVTTMSCVQTGTATPVAANFAADQRSGTYAVPANPVNVTCTIINDLKSAGVFVQKAWAANSIAGNTATLSAATNPAYVGAVSAVSTAPNSLAGQGLAVTAFAGNTVYFNEVLAPANDAYNTTWACAQGATNLGSGSGTAGSLAITAAMTASATPVICTITNTRKTANVTLTKSWGNSPVNGDGVTLAIAGGNTPVGGSSVLGGATTPATSGAFVGSVITISETAIAGTDLANYTTTVACSYGANIPVVVANGQFTVPSGASNTTIGCVYTNVRKSATVTLDKAWANGRSGDTAALTIAASYKTVQRATGTGSSTAPTNTTAGNGRATLVVHAGETVNVSEVLGAGNVGGYTPTLVCTGATPAPNTGVAGTFVIPSTPVTVGCVITNTRTTAQFTLAKTWNDPVGGVTVNLNADGTDSAPMTQTPSVSPTGASNSVTVFSGETVKFSEAFTSAGVAAHFTSTLSCSPAAPAPTAVDAENGVLSSSIAIGKVPVASTCTFNNVRKSATLNLAKTWVNGATNDDTALTIDALAAAGPEGSATAVVPAGGNGASVATASTTVYSGTDVTLAEAFNAANTGTYGVTAFTCSSGSIDWGNTPLDRDATVLITSAMTAAPINCSITNTRTASTVTVAKGWVDPGNGPASVTISATGGSDVTGNSSVRPSPTDGSVTIDVLSGESITVAEVWSDAAGQLGAQHYNTTLDCSNDATNPVAGQYSRVITIAASPTPVTCTFVNTRKSATLVLAKDWVAEVAGDTASLSIETDTDAATVATSVGDGSTSAQTASVTAYSGADYDLTELLGAGNTALYTPTGLVCSGANPATGSGTTTGNVLIAPADASGQATVTCTFTNTAQRGNIIVVKNVAGANGTFNFAGSWPATGATITPSVSPAAFPITTVGQTGTVTFMNVLVPKNGGYTVSETDPRPNFDGTTLVCAGSAGGDTSTGDTSQPLDGTIDLDNGETVTCTFTNTQRSTIVVIKDAQPDAATDFEFNTGEPPAPGGLLADAFTLDDNGNNADGTSNTFTSGLLPANATYTVTEGATAGWTLSAALSSCTTGGSFAGTTASIIPAPGATVTCTFVNTANPAGLTATKSVEGLEPGTQWGPFEFTLTGGTFTGAASQAVGSGADPDPTASWSNLVEGSTYTITEADAAGYTEGAFTCTVLAAGAQGAPVVLVDANASAGFQLVASAGAVYSCAITNTAETSQVSVTKNVAGFAPGATTAWSFDFTLTPNPITDPVQAATQPSAGTGNGAGSTATWAGLTPGASYTIAETAKAGYTTGALTCVGVIDTDEDANNESVTFVAPLDGAATDVACSITNTANTGNVSVTKTVTGVAATQAWSFDFQILPLPAGETNPKAASGVGNATSTPIAWVGLLPGQPYTVSEVTPVGWTAGPISCVITPAGGPALPADDDGTFNVLPGDSVSCDFDNVATTSEVSVTKTVAGLGGSNAWSFDFTLTPVPDTDPTSAVTSPSSGSGNVAGTTATFTGLVPGATYVLAETSVVGYTPGTLVCTGVSDSDDIPTSVTFVAPIGALEGTEVSCSITNTAATGGVSVTKVVDGGLLADTNWGPFTFTITPDPDGADGQNASANVTKATPTATWTGLVPGAVYTVAETGSYAGFELGTMSCSNVVDTDPNPQSVTFVAPLSTVSVACSITNTALADVTPTKVIDPDNLPVRNADGTWTLNYLLTVANAVDAGVGVYDLGDEFAFGGGVTIAAESAAAVGVSPVGLIVNPDFDGVIDTVVATDVSIAPGVTHTYRVTVIVNVAVGPDTDGDCILGEDDGTGFLNSMSIEVDGGEPVTESACAEFATLTLVKQVVNDNGGNATVGQFTLTGTGTGAMITGTSPVSSAVPVGTYVLTETQLDGYTTDGYSCVGGTEVDDTVVVAGGSQVVCTIVNDDAPVDLQLVKSDGGITAVAGGAPFDYTISVQNVGARDADLGEPVTVTDVLPDGLVWVSFPSNCSQAGQTLTCSIDPALLPAGGAPVVTTLTVRALPGAESGTFVNEASVTTSDDPGPEDPTCPENPESNNVDCEETPVDREGDIQIIKSDDVATLVVPGETFNYTLSVKNVGLSTILSGAEVTDDLPAQLVLVGVTGGAGWGCNNSDPILCTYGPELAPGASAPDIVVQVRVNADAQGTNIVNNAVVTGAVDRDCPVVPSELALVEGCNLVTDEDDENTPMTSNADLRIDKTSSVDDIGPGGSFNWILDVTNNGPGAAINVVVADTLPDTVTVTSVSSAEFICSFVGNEVTCTRASMASGSAGRVTIAVMVKASTAAGTTENLGRVESDTPDPDRTNNSDTDPVNIVVSQPPAVTLPPPPPVEPPLPQTGGDIAGTVTTALWLLLAGGALIVITRRRKRGAAAS